MNQTATAGPLGRAGSYASKADTHAESLAHPTLLGLGIVAVSGLGFGAWAMTAPLDGAVVTIGTFVAAGQNKQIQHLEGGIVSKVNVKEGDLVEAGQTLGLTS